MTAAVVARKVSEVRRRVARVRALLPETVGELLSQRTETEALILNLYLALQACSDLALHVVADRGLGVPGEVRGAFELLGERGLVEPGLAHRLAAAVGLRNRIAHQYEELDLARVHEAASTGLGDLELFARAVAEAYGL